MREMVQMEREPVEGGAAMEVQRTTQPHSGSAPAERTSEQAVGALRRAIASAEAASVPLVQTKLAVGPAGISAFDSKLFYSWLVPTLASWNDFDDSEIVCVAGNADSTPLEATIKNSQR